ncbi:MAG TPA: MBL fold metallo-hydrolase [Prolixibacteraceae bacterium]|nr:MBL fold metallo-hydrolase [Prolixibacteraceae bacterium]
MVEICALASGSNGNSYYIGNNTDAILVDAGISTRQLMQRFDSRRLDPRKLRGVFLSHEHSDHSRGLQVLSKRHHLTVWMSKHTYYALPPSYRPMYVELFEPGETLTVGPFQVHTFLKNHDAAEPCSFRIEIGGKSIGVLTDIGMPCERVRREVNHCQALFMETNYDEKMLWDGPYPWPLKKRVASDVGHLSNVQALGLVEQEAHPDLECIFLSHLSQENNNPSLAFSVFEPLQGKTVVKLTSRIEASEVYRMIEK